MTIDFPIGLSFPNILSARSLEMTAPLLLLRTAFLSDASNGKEKKLKKLGSAPIRQLKKHSFPSYSAENVSPPKFSSTNTMLLMLFMSGIPLTIVSVKSCRTKNSFINALLRSICTSLTFLIEESHFKSFTIYEPNTITNANDTLNPTTSIVV